MFRMLRKALKRDPNSPKSRLLRRRETRDYRTSVGELKHEYDAGSASTSAIVFLHGFLSSSKSAWTAPGGARWPINIGKETNSHVYFFDYKNHWFGRSSVATLSYTKIAERLVDVISKELARFERIIFVTHSFGGLIFKQMCVNASKSDPLHRESLKKINGLVAYACPNNGSKWAMLSLIPLVCPTENFKTLKKNNKILHKLSEDFAAVVRSGGLGRFRIQSYGELGYTFKVFRVDPTTPAFSGLPDLSNHVELPLNHFDICKRVMEHEDSWQRLVAFVSSSLTHSDGEVSFSYIPR